jgi:hypothetical protein
MKKSNNICFYSINLIITTLFFIFLASIIYYYHHSTLNPIIINNKNTNHLPSQNYYHENPAFMGGNIAPNPNYDVYLNPYTPPIKDDGYYFQYSPQITNVPTRSPYVNAEYRQIGILTPVSEKDNKGGNNMILPLFGRAIYSNRDKWQYYTMSNENNSVKLSIYRFKKNCMKDTGCTEIYSNDTVYVDGYKTHFSVSLYETY